MTIKEKIFKIKYFLFKLNSRSFSRDLSMASCLSAEKLELLNLQRRKKMVEFVFTHIPFYRQKYSLSGFELGDIQQQGFFEKLPIVEKNEIRESVADLVNPSYNIAHLPAFTTGGSTGTPLRTYGDPRIPNEVISWRTLNWWGTDISDDSGYLYRAVPVGWKKVMQQLLLWPTKRVWLSEMNMTDHNMDCLFRDLHKKRVSYLVGYVGALDVFACYLDKYNRRLTGLKAVWTTSSPLPPGKRMFLEHIFGCNVYTQYGSCEFYWIAAECNRKKGMHIANDIRHVEVVDGGISVPKDQFGDLVVSDLLNRAFPLIRYRLGDRGRLLKQPCYCSLPFPLMDYVKGRISDSIVTPSGGEIPGEYWTTIFDDYADEVKSFQIYQAKDLSITVRYEARNGVDCSKLITIVREKLIRKMGPRAVLNFVETEVKVNDNGKTRFVISDAK